MTLGREHGSGPARGGAGAGWRRVAALLTLATLITVAGGCATEESTESSDFAACDDSLGGTPWTPQVPGAASTHHDPSVELINTAQTATVPLLGLGQGADCSSANSGTCPDTASRIATMTSEIGETLGPNGSVSLVAEPFGIPTDLVGSAWPMLVSLKDANLKEWIGFDLTAGSPCMDEGFF